MKKSTKKKGLPDFDKMTYEEEAHWWETHDPEEYKGEFVATDPFEVEPGALKAPKKLRELSRQLVSSNLESAVRIRLTKQDHSKLKVVAKQKGIGVATLARMWILEKLQERGHKRFFAY